MRTLYLDFETYSEADITHVGSFVYVNHPSTEVLCYAYAVDDDGVKLGLDPRELVPLMKEADVIVAHNAPFDMAVAARFVPGASAHIAKWRCSMAAALRKALPARLKQACDVAHLPAKAPADALSYLCKPKRPSKADPRTRYDDPSGRDADMYLSMYEYCIQDVVAMRALWRYVGCLEPDEQDLWLSDYHMGEYGVGVNRDRAEAIRKACVMADIEATANAVYITGGQVHSLKSPKQVTKWLTEQLGYEVTSCAAGVCSDIAKDPSTPDHVREFLAARASAGKSSTAKIERMLAWASVDGRMHHTMQYHGAKTGRNTGRGPQVLNLPRPSFDVDPEVWDVGGGELVSIIYGDRKEAAVNSIRNIIVPKPGRKLVAADYSGIESRLLSCVAGEEWKVEAFRRLDKGEGKDNYLLAADVIFGYECVSKKTHPDERQVGKVAELACGYQGGVNAWRNFDSSDRFTDQEVKDIINKWRAGHPATTALWRDLQNAAIKCVMFGQVVDTPQGYRFEIDADWLTVRLLSGRKLYYFQPELRQVLMPWLDDDGNTVTRPAVTCESIVTGIWSRRPTYGGMWTENVIQAESRDLLKNALLTIRREYPNVSPIMTVYDEIVCEVDEDDDFDHSTLEEIMLRVPDHAAHWPIAAEGWTGGYYRK